MLDQAGQGQGERRWYVVQTQPAQERLASRCIAKVFVGPPERGESDDNFAARAQDHVWLPKCTVRRRLRRTVSTHKGPLFPTYLFARFDASAFDWGRIEDCLGVAGVLCNDEKPVALADHYVKALADAAADGGGTILIDVEGAGPAYAENQPLRIKSGPLHGFVGLYVDGARERITLLLDMLGRPVRHTLPEALVEPA